MISFPGSSLHPFHFLELRYGTQTCTEPVSYNDVSQSQLGWSIMTFGVYVNLDPESAAVRTTIGTGTQELDQAVPKVAV
jgi:hypothetical protein